MFPYKGELILEKGFFSFREFWRAYMAAFAKVGDHSPIVSHLRITTVGGTTKENCHPHWVIPGKQAIAHNGTLQSFSRLIPKHDDRSDSKVLAEELLPNLPPNWTGNKYLRKMVQDFIGYTNKVVILDAQGNLEILSELQGDWKDNKSVWYSNTNHLVSKPTRKKKYFVHHNKLPCDSCREKPKEYRFYQHGMMLCEVCVKALST